MNATLKKVVAWFRTGYPSDAPQSGHAALFALCPAAAGVVGRPQVS